MGDLLNQRFPSNYSRVPICSTLYPPPFLEKISCLALIMGDSRDSGQSPGFDPMAKRREIIADSRTNHERNRRHVPDSRTGLVMGDFLLVIPGESGGIMAGILAGWDRRRKRRIRSVVMCVSLFWIFERGMIVRWEKHSVIAGLL